MDELELIRAARPPEDYPDERRLAARVRLLAEMTGPRAPGPALPRARSSWRRQAVLAAGLAAGVAAAVTAVQVTRAPAPGSRPGPAGSAARHLLVLAARTADAPPPAGTRWLVTEIRDTSAPWSPPGCAIVAKAVSGRTYVKIPGACPATPPGFLPGLRAGIRITAWPASPDYPPGLPDAPGPLLARLYRWLSARSGDSRPGRPPGRAELSSAAFDTLTLMINEGVTRPSRGVLLEAVSMIPGVKVAPLALGAPGIAVTASSHGGRSTIIIDPVTYKIIGGSDTFTSPGGRRVTLTDTQSWQAYYDAAGRRL